MLFSKKRLLFSILIIILSLLLSGCLELTITPELDNPLQITFEGVREVIPKGEDMEVTAVVTDENGADVVPDSYEWYLEGALLPETSSTITIGSTLDIGRYTLDLVVAKDSILSSEGFTFEVSE